MRDRERTGATKSAGKHGVVPTAPVGKRVLTDQIPDATEAAVDRIAGRQSLTAQLQASGGEVRAPAQRSAHEVATDGVSGAATEYPHRSTIERLFGRPIPVTAHTDAVAAEATARLGTEAYAFGGSVAFQATSPPLHVAAHEAAHVVQQHAGIQLAGGVGAPGDVYEQQANAIADRVVAGQSAADLLDGFGGDSGTGSGDGRSSGGATRSVQRYDHIVSHGDTLSSIAELYSVTVEEMAGANPQLPPHAILHSGQHLHVPSQRYTVREHDTLYGIARQFGTTVATIQTMNQLRDDHIAPGRVLEIPRHHIVGTPPAGQPAHPPAGQPAHPPAGQPAQPPTGQPTHPPAGQPAQPPAAAGHVPGHDYAAGAVRERSFVRGNDLHTIQTVHGHRVFFANGAGVDLVATHPDHTEWIQVRGSAFEDTHPHPRAIAAPVTGWIQRRWTDMTLGVFRDLGVTDRTRELGDLARANLAHRDVHNIVLHETESPSQQSTMDGYRERIGRHSDIGAQYLIGETGEISLITDIDRLTSHVHPNLPSGANSDVDNRHSIGIEHVGMHRDITQASRPPGPRAPRAQRDAWAAEMRRVRADLDALPLSPPFHARLRALDDRHLFQTMSDNRWMIDVDINGRQKRSSFLLTQRLRTEFGLGQADMYAHEDVAQKTQGEGGNIRDFLVAREGYPGQVQALRALVSARPQLQQSAGFMAVLQREEAMVRVLAADATSAENTALAAERAAGRRGDVTARETARVNYYDDFWNRVAQIANLLQFLQGPNAADTTQLASLLAAWRG